MSIQQTSSFGRLALVNSFYGPGATACWYLTCFSCLLSWTLHPKKRIEDAITSDFIAIVTFPTVASAHLITQVRSWPSQSSVGDQTLQQMYASLAASLIIIETYLPLCIILLLPGVFTRTPKRLCLLAATGVFCVLSETYLYLALPSIRQAPGVFERTFIIDSLILLVLILALVSILLGLLFIYLYVLLCKCCTEPSIESLDTVTTDMANDFGLSNKPRQVSRLTYLALPFMTFAMGGCSGPSLFVDLFALAKLYRNGRTNWTGKRSFFDEFFPKTDASIMDLDQAVALLAGMTILGFALYSAADAHYKSWWEEEKKRRDEFATIDEAIRRRRLEIHADQSSSEEDPELEGLRMLRVLAMMRWQLRSG